MSVLLSPRQRLSGAVPIVLLGRRRTLRFTMESLFALEDSDAVDPMDRLLAMLCACLLHEDPDIDAAALAESLDYTDVQIVSVAVGEALRLGTTQASDDKRPAACATAERSALDRERVWSYARHELALSEAEFWSLTPRQFGLLSDRREERRINDLRGHAMVAAIIANANRDREKKPEPFTDADFLPDLKRHAHVTEKQAVGRDLRQRSIEIFKAHGARTVRVKPSLPFLLDSKKPNG